MFAGRELAAPPVNRDAGCLTGCVFPLAVLAGVVFLIGFCLGAAFNLLTGAVP